MGNTTPISLEEYVSEEAAPAASAPEPEKPATTDQPEPAQEEQHG